jgi:hypothetical protein
MSDPLQGFLVGPLRAVYEPCALAGGKSSIASTMPLQVPEHADHARVNVFAMRSLVTLVTLVLSERSMFHGRSLGWQVINFESFDDTLG